MRCECMNTFDQIESVCYLRGGGGGGGGAERRLEILKSVCNLLENVFLIEQLSQTFIKKNFFCMDLVHL